MYEAAKDRGMGRKFNLNSGEVESSLEKIPIVNQYTDVFGEVSDQ